ncbi:MAG TPA: hypothetical protein PLZ57_03170 [Pseudobdellovibrionaceae bacterium]|nr:hypothetical protein [Pseudobdellovibrionaceae bacterium]
MKKRDPNNFAARPESSDDEFDHQIFQQIDPQLIDPQLKWHPTGFVRHDFS